jgi:hypothetical protein
MWEKLKIIGLILIDNRPYYGKFRSLTLQGKSRRTYKYDKQHVYMSIHV